MITTNDLRVFAKYQTIYTIRQSDGAKLIASRTVIDEKLPVRWDVEVTYPQPLSFFKAPEMSITELPSTSRLLKKAKGAGFGDWYPVPEKMVKVFPIDALGDDSQGKLASKYPEPDA